MIDNGSLARAEWRTSSFSGNGGAGAGNCVEVAAPAGGAIALRSSDQPDKGVVLFTRAEITAWVKGCKAGEFDDLDAG